jgi:hypothetical protein
MPDSISTPGDRTVVVHRHGALTYISLGFNALILLLILIGIVCHHHHPRPPGEAGEGGPQGHHQWADRDGGNGFRHGGDDRMHHGWGRHEGGGGPGGENGKCEMGGRPDFDRGGHSGWGDGHPGFGGSDMGGGNGDDHFMPKTPPSAEEMTDRFMLMMTQKLALTDPESAQIRPIVQSGIEQFQKDMEAQKQAHQKMIDDAKTKVRAVLTPDQQKQFDDLTAHFGPPATPPGK